MAFQPPSRQGVKWSRYRCKCQARNQVFCVCGDLGLDSKRVFFKDLNKRNLAGLFQRSSSERIQTPLTVNWNDTKPY